MPGGNKICLGCQRIGRWDSSGRCPECYVEHKSKYDAEYFAQRHADAMRMAAGASFNCPRCTEPIEPGDEWDEGHQDDGTLAPEHRSCNRGARRSKVWLIA